MAKLNLSRPYGTVYGNCGHRYEQDGKIFAGTMEEIVKEGAAAPVTATSVELDDFEAASVEVAPPKPTPTRRAPRGRPRRKTP